MNQGIGKPIAGIVFDHSENSVLPNFDTFYAEVKDFVSSAFEKSINSRVESLDVARRIYEYASDSQVRLKVDCLNAPEGKRKEGSPKKAHRYVVEELVKKSGVSDRTYRYWMADWNVFSKAVKLPLVCPEDEFRATLPETTKELAALFEQIDAADETGDKKHTELKENPEEIGQKYGKKACEPFLDANGNIRLIPRAFEEWNKWVKRVQEAHGNKSIPRQK